MNIQFGTYDVLDCPNCGEGNLHQGRIKIFEREEDNDLCHITTVDDSGTHIEVGPGDDNPSKRRHGLLISFWCECCPARPTLGISQHKGSTYLQWQ